jgi:hypothetical protein
MDGLKIKVRHVGGRTEELTVETDQVLIGSGAHCEVRLPIDQARFEHVLVRSGPAGLFASARSIDPPPTLSGAEFTEAPILPGSVLRVSQSAIEIEPIALTVDPSTAKQDAGSRNARPLVILVLGIAASAAIYLARPHAKKTGDEPAVIPELFGATGGTCPQTEALAAEALAQSKVSLANAKRERSPFYVQDGIGAVHLYQLAGACFRMARRYEDAEQALAAADALKETITEGFRVHRMRLKYALTSNDWEMALGQVRILRTYTSFGATDDGDETGKHSDDEYATWLSNLNRQIELAHSGKKKK